MPLKLVWRSRLEKPRVRYAELGVFLVGLRRSEHEQECE
jgi:hypothetical protein